VSRCAHEWGVTEFSVDSGGAGIRFGAMKSEFKSVLRVLSLLCFCATLALWVVGICGYGFAVASPVAKDTAVGAWFFGGGTVVATGLPVQEVKTTADRVVGFWFGGGELRDSWIARRVVLPSFDVPLMSGYVGGSILIPYWLLLIAFGAAPTVRVWDFCVARREKRLFEEAMARKRAEESARRRRIWGR